MVRHIRGEALSASESLGLCVATIRMRDFRFGSKTEVAPLERHVRSTLNSRHREATPAKIRTSTGDGFAAGSGLDRSLDRVGIFLRK
jgi:hypothetical protein